MKAAWLPTWSSSSHGSGTAIAEPSVPDGIRTDPDPEPVIVPDPEPSTPDVPRMHRTLSLTRAAALLRWLDTGLALADFRPADERVRPPRPTGHPTWALTRAGHVVPWPRPDAAERRDPTKQVTGEGWPAWYPTEAIG